MADDKRLLTEGECYQTGVLVEGDFEPGATGELCYEDIEDALKEQIAKIDRLQARPDRGKIAEILKNAKCKECVESIHLFNSSATCIACKVDQIIALQGCVCPECIGAGYMTFNTEMGWHDKCAKCKGTGKVQWDIVGEIKAVLLGDSSGGGKLLKIIDIVAKYQGVNERS